MNKINMRKRSGNDLELGNSSSNGYLSDRVVAASATANASHC